MVAHTCSPCTSEAKARRLKVQDQPDLQRACQNTKQKSGLPSPCRWIGRSVLKRYHPPHNALQITVSQLQPQYLFCSFVKQIYSFICCCVCVCESAGTCTPQCSYRNQKTTFRSQVCPFNYGFQGPNSESARLQGKHFYPLNSSPPKQTLKGQDELRKLLSNKDGGLTPISKSQDSVYSNSDCGVYRGDSLSTSKCVLGLG